MTPVEGGAADIHPLLYYATLNGWMRIFGQSPDLVRLYSVFTGLLTVAVVYRLAAELFEAGIGLAAALITALAPFHIQYSQETRMYALLTLWLLLGTWCYLRAWRGRGKRWWAAFAMLAALAMYTQQLAAFYLAALGLLPVVRRRWRKLPLTVASAGLAFVLYLPWLVNLPSQLDKLKSYYWIRRPSVLRPLLSLRSLTVVALDIPSKWAVPTLFVGVVLAVFLFVQLVVQRRRLRGNEREALIWVVWLSLGSLVLLWIASQLFVPMYLDRALLTQGIIFYVALAWLLLRGRMPGPIVGFLIVGWSVGAAVGYYYQTTWHTFPNPPFDEAVAFLEQRVAGGDVVVHSNKLTMLPMTYYARFGNRELSQVYMADRPGSPEDTLALPTQEVLKLWGEPCVAVVANGAARVWTVIFDQEEAQYTSLAEYDNHPHLSWLRAHYVERDSVAFEDLLIIPFSQPDDYAPTCDGGGS